MAPAVHCQALMSRKPGAAVKSGAGAPAWRPRATAIKSQWNLFWVMLQCSGGKGLVLSSGGTASLEGHYVSEKRQPTGGVW